MESHARALKHPLHPMLVVFPTALFPLLLVFNALHAFFGDEAFWRVGFWIAALGVLTTLAAMVPGIIDMKAIRDGTKAHRTGMVHAVIGTGVLVLYVAALAVRWPAGSEPHALGLVWVVDALGLVAVSAQGWFGGELVYKHRVGVLEDHEGADPAELTGGAGAPGGARAGARRRGASRP